eukprot:scaffold39980_cov50-Attheya_sp.AAC.3
MFLVIGLTLMYSITWLTGNWKKSDSMAMLVSSRASLANWGSASMLSYTSQDSIRWGLPGTKHLPLQTIFGVGGYYLSIISMSIGSTAIGDQQMSRCSQAGRVVTY